MLNPNARRVLVPNVPTVRPSGNISNGRQRSVVMVGRIGPQKDPEYYVALKQEVTSVDPAVNFIWVGDGNARQKSNLEDAGVTVTGWLDDAALVAELEAAGIYAHSARYEGFPLSVLDAAACGLPVVARAIPAFDGSPVAQFPSVASHAEAIVRYFSSSTGTSDLAGLNAKLLDVMNSETHRQALLKLYERMESVSLSPVAGDL
ncbi:hypothetical protein CTI14_20595 [Methylobacterium radiotolerans]|nr:hypothetical protein CTI14_20595 [Methylobacterium radiotolerans]